MADVSGGSHCQVELLLGCQLGHLTCFLTEGCLGSKGNILKERQAEAAVSLRPRPGNCAMVVCYVALVTGMEIQQTTNLAMLFPRVHGRALMI